MHNGRETPILMTKQKNQKPLECISADYLSFLSSFFFNFPQHISPLIILEIILDSHSSQVYLPAFVPHPQRKEYMKVNLCFPYTHWWMVKVPLFSPLKITEVPPPRFPPEATIREELHFRIVLFSFGAFLSCSACLCILGIHCSLVT